MGRCASGAGGVAERGLGSEPVWHGGDEPDMQSYSLSVTQREKGPEASGYCSEWKGHAQRGRGWRVCNRAGEKEFWAG